MEFKTTIPLQEAVDFCNNVINTATVDGVYLPALYEYSVRVNAVLHFSDYSFSRSKDGLIDQDDACRIAFETTYFEDIFQQSPQLRALVGACREQIDMNHATQVAAMRPADQFQRLVDIVENGLGTITEITNGLGHGHDTAPQ